MTDLEAAIAEIERVQSADTTHRRPVGDSTLTPCCRKVPSELPYFDRLTENPRLVTYEAIAGRGVVTDLEKLLTQNVLMYRDALEDLKTACELTDRILEDNPELVEDEEPELT
jgi:hypothetical protein